MSQFHNLVLAALKTNNYVESCEIHKELMQTEKAKEIVEINKQYEEGLITFAEWVSAIASQLLGE